MGVNATLFVATKKENILDVMPKVIETLNTYIRKELDEYWKKEGFENRTHFIFSQEDNKVFTNGIREVITSDFRSCWVNFTIHGENRRVFVTHNCSTDYKDIFDGEKIIFSLGYWGLSDEIMKVIAEPLKEFGDVYYDFNDCDDQDFIKL